MILYIETPEDSTKTLLDLINELSKAIGYKINVKYKQHFSTVTTNYLKKKELNQSHLQSHKKKNTKYLRINLTKEVKGLYSENYKTLMKEIKEDTDKQKGRPCS